MERPFLCNSATQVSSELYLLTSTAQINITAQCEQIFSKVIPEAWLNDKKIIKTKTPSDLITVRVIISVQVAKPEQICLLLRCVADVHHIKLHEI